MTELPTTFGKYLLTEKLATGGMAEIYLAKLIGPGGFEKQLVIKQIHPRLSGQRPFVDLFVAEAKTLVALSHGNIVPIYELGVVDDTYFIAMDYIDGPTLYRLTELMARRDEPVEPALAAWIVGRVLEGLDYAHRKGDGVIHRDLSPRNVMLSRDGEVKLVDFGIAVTLGAPDEREPAPGAPAGSYPYMSPEQVRQEPLTGQSDLFSVGVLLWEMLAGQRLFARATADATLDAVLALAIPRPSQLRPEVPASLDAVVMRALERDRADRWPAASDMLDAIHRFLYGLDRPPPGPRAVAALVAAFCPPETRRQPTHADAPEHGGSVPGATTSATDSAAARPDRGGPATAVIPRPAPGPVRGRQTSFATHVDLAPLLDDGSPPPRTGAASDVPTTADAAALHTDAARRVPGRSPPGPPALLLAGFGGLVLAAASVWVFLRGRDAVLRDDAATFEPAPSWSGPGVDAPGSPSDARGGEAVDAPRIDGGSLDATAPSADGPLAVSPDPDRAAGARAPRMRDAGAPPDGDDAQPRPDAAIARGTATLTIGADPWGEIYVDGAPVGRTPREVVVPAGPHRVQVVFPVETPPRTQTFDLEVSAGERRPLQADFSR